MRYPGESRLQPAEPDEIQKDNRNGYAYWMFTPTPAAPLDEALPSLSEYPGAFPEMSGILTELIRYRNLLVGGQPGSGKSHLIKEIQTACIVNNLPTYTLTMHKNGGKPSGIDNIRPSLDDFTDRTHETGGGLVILDNLDYIAYKGSDGRPSMARRKAAYAAAACPLIRELVDNKDLAVLGTIHDDAWREGRWQWQNPEIDEPAQEILDMFPAKVEFEGTMALASLVHIIKDRCSERNPDQPPVTEDEAALVMRELRKFGRANFFHAKHLDVKTFLHDPQLAIEQIEAGRTERRSIRKG